MNVTQSERIRDAIIEQATYWYVRHRDEALKPEEQAEFLQWLRASLQHTSEYLAVARLSGGLREAIADLGLDEQALLLQAQEATDDAVVNFDSARLRNSTKRRKVGAWRTVGVAVAAATLLAAGLYWTAGSRLNGLSRPVAAAHGEQRTVTLRDGSVMHVNVSSQARVRFSDHERLVVLEQGQAMFEVAHDPQRPFRVVAGSTEVVAVGTQFDVYRRDAEAVTVTVVQGEVDVLRHEISNRGRPRDGLRLAAGEQVQVDGTGAAVKSIKTDARAATAWVRREIMFEGRPLREVTREFNRYIPVPIEIEDPALGELQVSGVFNAYDADSFIVFLRQYEVHIQQNDTVIRVGPKNKVAP